MATGSTSAERAWSEATQAELDRFGFSDPYDPRFIYAAVFGTKMIGRAQRWPDIDFAALTEVNPDVAGWIRMPGTPIDYPVVAAHEDKSYYLTHNFSGDESLHGAVSLALACGGRIGGRNTVLDAHTMADWSMFRAVRALCDQAYLDEHPHVYLMAHNGTRLRGTWFAGARFHGWDPWPEKAEFDGDGDFARWLGKVEEGNWLRSDVSPNETSRILTCTTCARTPGKYGMRALFAVLEEA